MIKLPQKLVEEPVARTPPHSEPTVPYEGNRLKTPPFPWLWRLKERVINLRPWQRMHLEEARLPTIDRR
jgi:hypothetical protein